MNRFSFNTGDCVLFILAQEVSRLGGVEPIINGKWYGYDKKDITLYPKKELIDIKNKIEKNNNSEIHKIIAKFQKKYKHQVYVYDLSFYNLGKKYNLKCSQTYTLQDVIDGKDIKFETGNYSNLVEMMNKCEHIVYIGEAVEGLNFEYFIDDFSTATIITKDTLIHKNIIEKIPNIPHLKIYEEITLEVINETFKALSHRLQRFEYNYLSPYDIQTLNNIKNKWGEWFKRHNIKTLSQNTVDELIKFYPFLKEFDSPVIEALWATYCKDTTRTSLANRPVKEDFFVDMFLMYSLYGWNEIGAFLINRPKISLTKAHNTGNNRDIVRFKSFIKKNELIEKSK